MELTIVDAFTDVAFTGNPAAVAICDHALEPARMQPIAAEMNLPETAFALARGDGSYQLRWFTPIVEVDLCGHATLATAHVLGGEVRFHTRSGELRCWPGPGDRIEMDFPAGVLTTVDRTTVLDGLDVRTCVGDAFYTLIELGDAPMVRDYVPDFVALGRLAPGAVILTAASDRAGFDCVSRVFCPNVGIPEDPATGSAHCLLATFWGDRLRRDELVGEQASRRGGVVHMRRSGERVVLGGRAISVARVELLV